MRAVVDARPALDPGKTGIGHYAFELIRHLPRADPDSEFVAWYLHARGVLRPRSFFRDPEAPNLSERASRFPARVFEPVSSRLSVPRLEWLLDFDSVLATNFLPPATRSRAVVLVVHDLAFRVFPETAPQIDARWIRRFRQWLVEAARVVVPSGATRNDLLEAERVDPEKIVVVHHGVDAEAVRSASPEAAEAVRQRFRLDGDYLLFVGGIEPRKNLPTLLRAFSRVRTDAKLVIAGGRVRWFPKAASELEARVAELPAEIRSRVVLTGYVAEKEKVALLAGARALAYPSLYEGFGFPVLEGMAARVPVLTSTVSSLPEVAGDAALLVDPNDEEAIAEGIRQLLDDQDLRNRLIAAGLARAAGFTWFDTARRTAAVLREAAGVSRG